MCPAQGVRVNVHHLMLDETLVAIAHTAGTVGIQTTILRAFLVKLLSGGTEIVRILGIMIITVVIPPVLIVVHGNIR